MQDFDSSGGLTQDATPHARGLTAKTPLVQSVSSFFRALCRVQDSKPYDNVSEKRCRSCMVCGRSGDAIEMEKVNTYMRLSTPANEPEAITILKRETYLNGLNAGCLLFLTKVVSQAAACDGTRCTTSADDQEVAPGTLPIY